MMDGRDRKRFLETRSGAGLPVSRRLLLEVRKTHRDFASAISVVKSNKAAQNENRRNTNS